MFTTPENWTELTLTEKRDARLDSWAMAQIEFTTPEAEQGYRKRAQMMKDAVQLKKPEAYPGCSVVGSLPGRVLRHHRP